MVKKLNIKSWRPSLNAGGLLCLAIAIYTIDYLLITDKLIPFSISSMFTWTSHHTSNWHVLAIAMLPIYLAFVIFGTATVSLSLGSYLQRWLTQRLREENLPR